jgi:hypothetical protein
MPTAGQPTLYKAEYCAMAHNYCLLSATNEDLASFFEVTRRTVDNWIATHGDFAKAVRSGRLAADARVARCLYDRAVGWEHKVQRTVMHGGKARKITDLVRYPPDTRACIFWLRNRRPDTWRERTSVAKGEDGEDWIAELDAAGERAREKHRQAADDTV